MTKRPINEVFGDCVDELASTVLKHAKTVDFSPVINTCEALISLIQDIPLEEFPDDVDNQHVQRVLTNVEKIMTSKKNGSDADNSNTDTDTPPPHAKSTPPQDYGEEGVLSTQPRTISYCCGSYTDAGKKDDAGTG